MSKPTGLPVTSPNLPSSNISNEPSTIEISQDLLVIIESLNADFEEPPLSLDIEEAQREINKMPLRIRTPFVKNLKKTLIEDKLQDQLKNIIK